MNVLVGANSAGKSSVIQSILLAAQTLGTAWTPRPLLLNGPLVQLGLPDDCINEQAKGGFAFGFEYQVSDQNGSIPGPHGQRGVVQVHAGFAVKGATLELDRSTVSTEVPGNEPHERTLQTVSFTKATKRVMTDRLRECGLKGERLKALLAADIVPVEVSEATLPSISAARFRQFLPWSLYEYENLNETALGALLRGAELVEDQLQRGVAPARRFKLRAGPRLRLKREEVPPAVAKFVYAYLRNEGVSTAPQKGSTQSVADFLENMSAAAIETIKRMEASDWFAANHDNLAADVTLTNATADEPFDSLMLAARQFFVGYVRHLGPIRLEPKPLYGLSEAASGDSVGSSGEYTAALLDSYGDRGVECPLLDSAEVIHTTLSEAVDYWLKAMGLLSSVDVQERGKLGYEISLRIEGVKKTLDLTAVGVGVSQALPVIVQGLVAPPGSLVMFEQPELHLHPDVQAAVGDFCVALARSGRQVILETHSEYLVNRLRRRAVEDFDGVIPDLVRLHFVERKDGATTVRPVRITSMGGLKDWPAGFMDQSAREAEAIIEALERRSTADDQSTH